jgi:hypothetical protein
MFIERRSDDAAVLHARDGYRNHPSFDDLVVRVDVVRATRR